MQLRVAERGTIDYSAAADYVRARYARVYGADVDPHPDCFLFTTRNERPDTILACAGFTFHSDGGFFSERYLPGTLDEALRSISDAEVTSSDVVEIGSFAATGGHGTELIRLLPIVAWCRGMRFILCTVTPSLQNAFARLDVPFAPLANAVPLWMDDAELARWGTYYDNSPTTGVILLDGIGQLIRNCTGRYDFMTAAVGIRAENRQAVLADAR